LSAHAADKRSGADLSNGSSFLTQSLVDYSYALSDLTQLSFRITTDAFLAMKSPPSTIFVFSTMCGEQP